MSDPMDFSAALLKVKSGRAIYRSGWNGTNMVIKAQYPDVHSKMTLPYLYIEYTKRGERCPWLASQTDLMAEDWYVDWSES